jgi:hypothetical protein
VLSVIYDYLIALQKKNGSEHSLNITQLQTELGVMFSQFYDEMKVETKDLRKVQCNEKYAWMVQQRKE